MASIIGVNELQHTSGTTAATIAADGKIKPAASGSVVAVRHYSNATRATIYSSAAGTIWTFTDTKLYGAESSIIIHANIIGFYDNSGAVGTYIEYDGTKSYSISYTYTSYDTPKLLIGTSKTTGKAAGSRTVKIGLDVANGGAGESPFTTVNPNGNDDARIPQMVSTIIVYEVIA